MKKRLLAISDIHGCYSEFIALLKKAAYNPLLDQLIYLEIIRTVTHLSLTFSTINLKSKSFDFNGGVFYERKG